jgi:hypothetical protein
MGLEADFTSIQIAEEAANKFYALPSGLNSFSEENSTLNFRSSEALSTFGESSASASY